VLVLAGSSGGAGCPGACLVLAGPEVQDSRIKGCLVQMEHLELSKLTEHPGSAGS
jgi:hypothetical protein